MKKITKPLYLYTFGKLELLQDEQPIDIPLKAQLLLAYLCRNTDKQPRDKLASLLWSDSSPSRAAHNLRMMLSVLRKEIPDYVDITRTHVQVQAIHLDAQTFADTLNDLHPYLNSQKQLATKQICKLDDAIALYNGHFIDGIHAPNAHLFDEWSLVEQEALRQRFIFAGSHLLDAYITQKQYDDGISLALRLLESDPLHEKTHHRLMILYAINGDDTSALQQFETFQDQLMDELGVEPGDAIIHTYEQVAKRQFNPDTLSIYWLTNPHVIPNNLPAEINTFWGREQEVEQLTAYIEQYRCVSLVGTGGIGKTRLALNVAGQLKSQFSDGVFLVELANLVNANLVSEAIHTALELEDTHEAVLDQLNSYLYDRRILLVLDNFEHLIEAYTIVDQLLRANLHLHILITSREPLRTYGEYVYHLQVLKDDAAQKLFIDRAQGINPQFDVTEKSFIQAICQKLEHLPLAIELATSRARTQSAKHIYNQLSVLELATSLRGVPDRQCTLFNTIEWSYNLLSLEAQNLYQQLAFFVGTWSVEVVKGICECDHVALLLDTLAECSLIQRVHNTNRYTMLETLRQHAHLKLEGSGQLHAVRYAFIVYYTEMVESYEVARRGINFHPRLNQHIQKNLDNIHAAIDYADEAGEYELAGRLIAALGTFWYLFGHGHEGLLYAQRILHYKERLSEQTLADLYSSIGQVMNNLNRLEDAKKYHQLAKTIYHNIGDLYGEAFINFCLAFHIHNTREVIDYLYQILPQAENLDSPSLLLSVLSNITLSYIIIGQTDEAEIMIHRIMQHPHIETFDGRSHIYNILAEIYRDKGQFDEALYVLTQSLNFEGSYTWTKFLTYEMFVYIYILKADYQMAYNYWLKFEQLKNEGRIPSILMQNYYLLKAMIIGSNDLSQTKYCLEQVFTTSYGESFYPSVAVAYLIYLLHVTDNQDAAQQLYDTLIYTIQDETRDYALSAMHWHYLQKAGFKNMESDEKLEQPSTPIFELANSYINKIACNIQV